MEELLFVGSCFADSIGQRFREEHFPVIVNPYGTMYNPVSVLHTIERMGAPSNLPRLGEACLAESECAAKVSPSQGRPEGVPRIVFITLGTNHVYRLKETGEIVDNCQKRPQRLFDEETLSVGECAGYLQQIVEVLRSRRPDVQIVFTVSPIRYQKYGFHESQLSKATLLLAVQSLECRVESVEFATALDDCAEGTAVANSPLSTLHSKLNYFPAYEIVLDELRDYRFYKEDMLHPSAQAVEYIWQQLVAHYFSPRAKQFLQDWKPIKDALNHRPFHPESEDYQRFLAEAKRKEKDLLAAYHV